MIHLGFQPSLLHHSLRSPHASVASPRRGTTCRARASAAPPAIRRREERSDEVGAQRRSRHRRDNPSRARRCEERSDEVGAQRRSRRRRDNLLRVCHCEEGVLPDVAISSRACRRAEIPPRRDNLPSPSLRGAERRSERAESRHRRDNLPPANVIARRALFPTWQSRPVPAVAGHPAPTTQSPPSFVVARNGVTKSERSGDPATGGTIPSLIRHCEEGVLPDVAISSRACSRAEIPPPAGQSPPAPVVARNGVTKQSPPASVVARRAFFPTTAIPSLIRRCEERSDEVGAQRRSRHRRDNLLRANVIARRALFPTWQSRPMAVVTRRSRHRRDNLHPAWPPPPLCPFVPFVLQHLHPAVCSQRRPFQ